MCLIDITWELGSANQKAVTSLTKSGYNEWEVKEKLKSMISPFTITDPRV